MLLFFRLRRLDSNKRPLGYEPNELPTAPLRDVCGCKYTISFRFILLNSILFFKEVVYIHIPLIHRIIEKSSLKMEKSESKKFLFVCQINEFILLLFGILCISLSMTLSKTRANIVDMARQLFAKMGFENTTMNDIALACKRSRRTLYTYFNSKEEIYMAVAEAELDILSEKMKRVAEEEISPDEKLIKMIYAHLDAIKESVFRNGTLRANFFRNIWQVESVRKRFDATELWLFEEVLREGVEKGTFLLEDWKMTAEIMHYCIKGIEVPHILGHVGSHLPLEVRKGYVTRLVLKALGIKEENNNHQ